MSNYSNWWLLAKVKKPNIIKPMPNIRTNLLNNEKLNW